MENKVTIDKQKSLLPILLVNFILLTLLNKIFVYLAAVCFAVGNGLMWPSFLSLLSKLAGERYQGSVQGMSSSAGAVASIIGLIFGGFLYLSIGVLAIYIHCHGFVIQACGNREEAGS